MLVLYVVWRADICGNDDFEMFSKNEENRQPSASPRIRRACLALLAPANRLSSGDERRLAFLLAISFPFREIDAVLGQPEPSFWSA